MAPKESFSVIPIWTVTNFILKDKELPLRNALQSTLSFNVCVCRSGSWIL